MDKEEKQKEVKCLDCGKTITVEALNAHRFMKIKGGGLIHWKCPK
jgi:hypothetical protein